jgi:hypothetical protein
MKKFTLILCFGLWFSPLLVAQLPANVLPDSVLLDIVKQQLKVMIVPDTSERDFKKLADMIQNDACYRAAANNLNKVLHDDNGFDMYDFEEALKLIEAQKIPDDCANCSLVDWAVKLAPIDVAVYVRKIYEQRINPSSGKKEWRVTLEIKAVNKYTAQTYATASKCVSNWMYVDDCAALVGHAFGFCNNMAGFSAQLNKRFLEEGKRGRTVEVWLNANGLSTEKEESIIGFLKKKALRGSFAVRGTTELKKRYQMRIPFYISDTDGSYSPAELSIDLEKHIKTLQPNGKFNRITIGAQVNIEIE